jgi:GAF domain-containing protein
MADRRSSGADAQAEILELARSVLSDLDLQALLERIAASARELTGARYAALGVLDAGGARLERFVTVGLDERTRRDIGPPPVGLGVLGELIRDPRPLRLTSVKDHPRSYGFPIGHPPMERFLGVPILLDGRPYGNLYLTDKQDSDFTEADEAAVVTLAGFAAIAIDHAERLTRFQGRTDELESTVAALDATVQIAQALAGETDVQTILNLVAKRGRALAAASAAVIEHIDDDGDRSVAAVAGDLPRELRGRPLDSDREVVLELDLVFRGRRLAALVLLGPLEDPDALGDGQRRLLAGFASSAATALGAALTLRREIQATGELAALERVRRALEDVRQETSADAMHLVIGGAADELASICQRIRGVPTDDT